jgi:hypothetical protein
MYHMTQRDTVEGQKGENQMSGALAGKVGD